MYGSTVALPESCEAENDSTNMYGSTVTQRVILILLVFVGVRLQIQASTSLGNWMGRLNVYA